jgi:hypothetical protein
MSTKPRASIEDLYKVEGKAELGCRYGHGMYNTWHAMSRDAGVRRPLRCHCLRNAEPEGKLRLA